jgi:hypothetical protein
VGARRILVHHSAPCPPPGALCEPLGRAAQLGQATLSEPLPVRRDEIPIQVFVVYSTIQHGVPIISCLNFFVLDIDKKDKPLCFSMCKCLLNEALL